MTTIATSSDDAGQYNKRDGRASSLIILPEPDDVDEPTTDANANPLSNCPEAGSAHVPQNDVKESPLSNRPEAVVDGATG